MDPKKRSKLSTTDPNGFYHFQRLAKDIHAVASRTQKTQIISDFVKVCKFLESNFLWNRFNEIDFCFAMASLNRF